MMTPASVQQLIIRGTEAVCGTLKSGISANRQRQAYANAAQAGYDNNHALQAVAWHLIKEYHANL